MEGDHVGNTQVLRKTLTNPGGKPVMGMRHIVGIRPSRSRKARTSSRKSGQMGIQFADAGIMGAARKMDNPDTGDNLLDAGSALRVRE